MVRKVISMETKLLAVLSSGLEVPVSEVCRQLGISRQTFYKYRRRWAAEGPAALVERSRRPNRSPQSISLELEDRIVRLRKDLPFDNGAQSIAYHLARSGEAPVPSVATIHRVLVRRGMVVAQPQKRPKVAWQRFEWPAPNSCWQIDATRWVLADGREVWIMDVLDDHSRLLVAARVCAQPTSAAAWDALSHGISAWGIPAHVLSDNGTCFTGRFLSGLEVDFERTLRQLGVRQIHSTPGHPQTCGKLERHHSTLKTWLGRHPPAATHDELQTQLDDWAQRYNHERPHRALQGATPHERWQATTAASPDGPIPAPPVAALRHVDTLGRVPWQRHLVGIGTEHAHHQVLVIARDDDLTIYGQHGTIRSLTLDRTRRYQPTGHSPGRRSRPS
jgi:transposase InsO family protein